METSILLNARSGPPHPTWLQIGAPDRALLQVEATGRCNCDRWGHPCPGCVQPNVQPEEMN